MTSLVKECSFQLRQLRQIRKCLDRNDTHLLVQAFVTAKFDYCNSLLYGISDKQLNKLPIIQNQTAKLITGGRKFDHVTPVLKSLHWLPVKEKILFKFGVLVFKCLNNLAPIYLANRCNKSSSFHNREGLRSSASAMLHIRSTSLKKADRDFEIAGPRFWNSLPSDLRQNGLTLVDFRKRLKTYLFGNHGWVI